MNDVTVLSGEIYWCVPSTTRSFVSRVKVEKVYDDLKADVITVFGSALVYPYFEVHVNRLFVEKNEAEVFSVVQEFKHGRKLIECGLSCNKTINKNDQKMSEYEVLYPDLLFKYLAGNNYGFW